MGEARGRDHAAVAPLLGAGQRPEHRAKRAVPDTELLEHPQRVRLARRLHDPSQHQLPERRILKRVEPETVVHARQDLPQHRGPFPGNHPRSALDRAPGNLQIKRLLPWPQPKTGLGHQHRKLGRRAGRPNVLENVVAPAAALSDLDLRGAGAAIRLPNEHHDPTLPTNGVRQPRCGHAPDQHKHGANRQSALKWHESGSTILVEPWEKVPV